MFYKQFSKIMNILNPTFVENFDYWLATLPKNNQKNITASVVSSRLEVGYLSAEAILKFSEQNKILEKYYVIKCPDCDCCLMTITKEEIPQILAEPVFCQGCDEKKNITLDDIYAAYKVISKPDVTEDQIAKEIEKRLNLSDSTLENFCKADSLSNNKTDVYESFYSPSESAYNEFRRLRDELDRDYGDNSTEKGNSLEILMLEIFKEIRGVKVSNDVRSETNQFDCTCISGIKTHFLSVFAYMAPYFIIECKNEPRKSPNNTYCNKLIGIMGTNESQLGIICGRKDATKTCFTIAREHYLKHMDSRKQCIIITFSDKDLKLLIDEEVNLLEYLEYKILQITANAPAATFEMFKSKEIK